MRVCWAFSQKFDPPDTAGVQHTLYTRVTFLDVAAAVSMVPSLWFSNSLKVARINYNYTWQGVITGAYRDDDDDDDSAFQQKKCRRLVIITEYLHYGWHLVVVTTWDSFNNDFFCLFSGWWWWLQRTVKHQNGARWDGFPRQYEGRTSIFFCIITNK
jgi:hypothetical protein